MPDDTASKDEVRERLSRLQLTHDDLAREMNVTRSAITQWLCGHAKSKRLDIAVPSLLRGIEIGQQLVL
ncbi:MAG TPA: hypothetical protein VN579_07280 [Bryobacteraceae bacterium]|nr:hypothetical protein [Bryobacteraceae bacterium]